jgi:hypothetical protein
MPETTINSYVLRFVREQPTGQEAMMTGWHGTIRHVQSDRQLRFVNIEGALRFIAAYVDIPVSHPPHNQ